MSVAFANKNLILSLIEGNMKMCEAKSYKGIGA